MKRYYSIFVLLTLTACSIVHEPEVVLRANNEKRPAKAEYMPPDEKPLKIPMQDNDFIPLAPQVGIRVPLEK